MLVSAATASSSLAANIKHVFVIAFENQNAQTIYAGSPTTPFINSLRKDFASAGAFQDELPGIASEPHYVWMEAGTNVFPDHAFGNSDADPKSTNSTASHEHLTAQIEHSGHLSWATYQESIGPQNGACPVTSGGKYAAKHNPFVFFQDVAGNPPAKNTPYCVDQTKPYPALAADLDENRVANYVFITPDLCNDMHGMWDKHRRPTCPNPQLVPAGDSWLQAALQRLIPWANANSGVIFITWDQNAGGRAPIAFFAIGPGVKQGYVSQVRYDHGSLVKTIEEIFDLPILSTVADKNDLSDLFRSGNFP
jgi:acid phosphatase